MIKIFFTIIAETADKPISDCKEIVWLRFIWQFTLRKDFPRVFK